VKEITALCNERWEELDGKLNELKKFASTIEAEAKNPPLLPVAEAQNPPLPPVANAPVENTNKNKPAAEPPVQKKRPTVERVQQVKEFLEEAGSILAKGYSSKSSVHNHFLTVDNFLPLVFEFTDGETDQLFAIFKSLLQKGASSEELAIVVCKFNASRSAKDQPNDQTVFQTLQNFIDSGKWKTLDTQPSVARIFRTAMNDAKKNGAEISAAKITAIADALDTGGLVYNLMYAISPMYITPSWAATGLRPLSLRKMCQNTGDWSGLSRKQQRYILQSGPAAFLLFYLFTGEMLEVDLDNFFCSQDLNGNRRSERYRTHTNQRGRNLSTHFQMMRRRLYKLVKS
jgi:hypothetical protein